MELTHRRESLPENQGWLAGGDCFAVVGHGLVRRAHVNGGIPDLGFATSTTGTPAILGISTQYHAASANLYVGGYSRFVAGSGGAMARAAGFCATRCGDYG